LASRSSWFIQGCISKSKNLSGKLNELYRYAETHRRPSESPRDYQIRKNTAEWIQQPNEYEIEVLSGKIECANGQVYPAELHRVVVYRTPTRFRKSLPKEVAEIKIKTITGGTALRTTGPSTICLQNESAPASLRRNHSYQICEGSVRVGTANFLRLVDESGEPYLYPDTMFRPVAISA
jgi:hypothetical protein